MSVYDYSIKNIEREEIKLDKFKGKVILKLIRKKRLPVAKTVGFQYKLFIFLQRIFPKSFVNWIIKKMYG